MKKKISYLIIFIIFLFSGVLNVEAASFSCYYKTGTPAAPNYIILSYNDSNDKFYLYRNSKSSDLDSFEWNFLDSADLATLIKFGEDGETVRKFRFADSYINDENAEVTTCPEKVYFSDSNIYVFNDGSIASWGANNELEEQYDYLFTPKTEDGVDPYVTGLGQYSSCGNLDDGDIKLEDYWIKDPGNNKSCLYAGQIKADATVGGVSGEKISCIIVQLIEEDSGIRAYSNFEHWTGVTNFDSSNITEVCSNYLYVKYGRLDSDSDAMPNSYQISNVYDKGFDSVLTVRHSNSTTEYTEEELSSCEKILSDELVAELSKYLNIIRILVPILVILLGVLDFAKAVFSSNEDGMKKAQSAFIKRLIAAVAFFLIPTLVDLLLKIANSVWGWNSGLCNLK